MDSVARLIQHGFLIPVQVFGGGDEEWSYGLSDRFSYHAPGGSDCNRAEFFLLRPSDQEMANPEVRRAIEGMLIEGEPPHLKDAVRDAYLGVWPNETPFPITDAEYKLILAKRTSDLERLG